MKSQDCVYALFIFNFSAFRYATVSADETIVPRNTSFLGVVPADGWKSSTNSNSERRSNLSATYERREILQPLNNIEVYHNISDPVPPNNEFEKNISGGDVNTIGKGTNRKLEISHEKCLPPKTCVEEQSSATQVFDRQTFFRHFSISEQSSKQISDFQTPIKGVSNENEFEKEDVKDKKQNLRCPNGRRFLVRDGRARILLLLPLWTGRLCGEIQWAEMQALAASHWAVHAVGGGSTARPELGLSAANTCDDPKTAQSALLEELVDVDRGCLRTSGRSNSSQVLLSVVVSGSPAVREAVSSLGRVLHVPVLAVDTSRRVESSLTHGSVERNSKIPAFRRRKSSENRGWRIEAPNTQRSYTPTRACGENYRRAASKAVNLRQESEVIKQQVLSLVHTLTALRIRHVELVTTADRQGQKARSLFETAASATRRCLLTVGEIPSSGAAWYPVYAAAIGNLSLTRAKYFALIGRGAAVADFIEGFQNYIRDRNEERAVDVQGSNGAARGGEIERKGTGVVQEIKREPRSATSASVRGDIKQQSQRMFFTESREKRATRTFNATLNTKVNMSYNGELFEMKEDFKLVKNYKPEKKNKKRVFEMSSDSKKEKMLQKTNKNIHNTILKLSSPSESLSTQNNAGKFQKKPLIEKFPPFSSDKNKFSQFSFPTEKNVTNLLKAEEIATVVATLKQNGSHTEISYIILKKEYKVIQECSEFIKQCKLSEKLRVGSPFEDKKNVKQIDEDIARFSCQHTPLFEETVLHISRVAAALDKRFVEFENDAKRGEISPKNCVFSPQFGRVKSGMNGRGGRGTPPHAATSGGSGRKFLESLSTTAEKVEVTPKKDVTLVELSPGFERTKSIENGDFLIGGFRRTNFSKNSPNENFEHSPSFGFDLSARVGSAWEFSDSERIDLNDEVHDNERKKYENFNGLKGNFVFVNSSQRNDDKNQFEGNEKENKTKGNKRKTGNLTNTNKSTFDNTSEAEYIKTLNSNPKFLTDNNPKALKTVSDAANFPQTSPENTEGSLEDKTSPSFTSPNETEIQDAASYEFEKIRNASLETVPATDDDVETENLIFDHENFVDLVWGAFSRLIRTQDWHREVISQDASSILEQMSPTLASTSIKASYGVYFLPDNAPPTKIGFANANVAAVRRMVFPPPLCSPHCRCEAVQAGTPFTVDLGSRVDVRPIPPTPPSAFNVVRWFFQASPSVPSDPRLPHPLVSEVGLLVVATGGLVGTLCVVGTMICALNRMVKPPPRRY